MSSETSVDDPVLFDFGGRLRKLTRAATEVVFRGSDLREGDDWHPRIQERGMRIDLSAVRWVDVSACVHVPSIVECALKNGIPRVESVFPNSNSAELSGQHGSFVSGFGGKKFIKLECDSNRMWRLQSPYLSP